jgi:hypothetical protein
MEKKEDIRMTLAQVLRYFRQQEEPHLNEGQMHMVSKKHLL